MKAKYISLILGMTVMLTACSDKPPTPSGDNGGEVESISIPSPVYAYMVQDTAIETDISPIAYASFREDDAGWSLVESIIRDTESDQSAGSGSDSYEIKLIAGDARYTVDAGNSAYEELLDILTVEPESPPMDAEQCLEQFRQALLPGSDFFSKASGKFLGYQADVYTAQLGDEKGKIEVYEFAERGSADTVSLGLAPDATQFGSGADTTELFWDGPPHLFKCFNMLIVYTGSDLDTLVSLDGVLGRQSAGAGPDVIN